MYAIGITHDITDTTNDIPNVNNIFYFTVPAPMGWLTGPIYLLWHV